MVVTRSMSVERGDSPPPTLPQPVEQSADDMPTIDEQAEEAESSPAPKVDKGKGRATDDDLSAGAVTEDLRVVEPRSELDPAAGSSAAQSMSEPPPAAATTPAPAAPPTTTTTILHTRSQIPRDPPRAVPAQRRRNPDPVAAGAPGIGNWMMEIPPVTRAWIVASVGTSVAVQCKVVSFTQLYLSWRLVLDRGQLWRLLSTFCFFGELSFELAFHLFFVMRYSRLLEEADYAGNKADYVVMLVFNAAILLLLTSMLSLPFLASSLAFSVVYIWGRRNPHVRLSVFGLITITAPYLPATLLIFSLFLNDPTSTRATEAAIGDALGLIAGHVYYFLTDVWPRELYYPFIDVRREQEKAQGIVRAPRWLHHLLGDDPARW